MKIRESGPLILMVVSETAADEYPNASWASILSVAPELTVTVPRITPVPVLPLFRASMPWLTTVPPLKLLKLDKTTVPPPVLVIPPLPEIVPVPKLTVPPVGAVSIADLSSVILPEKVCVLDPSNVPNVVVPLP